MKASDNVVIKRMLGSEGSFGQEDLGLAADFAVNVLAAVGNYGEIYDRYMGPEGLSFTLDRGLNDQWTEGGLVRAAAAVGVSAPEAFARLPRERKCHRVVAQSRSCSTRAPI